MLRQALASDPLSAPLIRSRTTPCLAVLALTVVPGMWRLLGVNAAQLRLTLFSGETAALVRVLHSGRVDRLFRHKPLHEMLGRMRMREYNAHAIAKKGAGGMVKGLRIVSDQTGTMSKYETVGQRARLRALSAAQPGHEDESGTATSLGGEHER
ncbi:MAG TPA: hypothetical protein DCL48_00345 [Alphaproteobacteria bacterium]|nr:hypothetical protein [Alphaproteobacteria bacterium]